MRKKLWTTERMGYQEASAVLEIMATDITGAMAGLEDTNPLVDVCQQTINAIDLAQSAIENMDELQSYRDIGMTPDEINRVLDNYGRGLSLRASSAERLCLIRDFSTDELRELIDREHKKRRPSRPTKPTRPTRPT